MWCKRAPSLPLFLLAALPTRVLGGDILSTTSFSTCINDPTIQVTTLNISFDKATNVVSFNVSGSSQTEQNVTAALAVTAYGVQVYTKAFNPCAPSTYVKQLCPVPAGTFSAFGTQNVPSQYVSQIPSIAYSIPDLDGDATLELKNSNNQSIACVSSQVSNGHSINTAVAKYVVGGIAASALAFSALGAVGHAGTAGATGPSPSFGEVLGYFQTIATSGMLSVSYPSVYQSYTRNFAFSTGLVSWKSMQDAIDGFRKSTGGNLTDDSYQFLKGVNVVDTNVSNGTATSLFRRSLLFLRQITTEVNGTTMSINGEGGSGTSAGTTTATSSVGVASGTASAVASGTSTASRGKADYYASGIQAYVEELSIPKGNTFTTVLLVFLCIVGAITIFILLFKLILELFAMAGKLPKSLESFRKRYWWRLAKTITNLVMLLYGTWVLYCIYQFSLSDSWATKLLAGITLALFTGLLAFFVWKISSEAREFKRLDGSSSALFDDKEVWIKYSLFYDAFKQSTWWVFIPVIVYMFARNAVIAAANGHGMAQAIGQMVVEGAMLVMLIFLRPYQRKSGNVINIVIQTVRIISVICILIFVEELGFSQTTKTITGVILIAVQSALTALLAILLFVNAIIACVRMNPHRKRRKEAEKYQRDLDVLTPLDARNSLLMDSKQLAEYSISENGDKASLNSHTAYGYQGQVPSRDNSPSGYGYSIGRSDRHADESMHHLVNNAASMAGRGRDRSNSPGPTLPRIEFGRAF